MDTNDKEALSEYPTGSEWRRWDLHVHTPGTNKNDGYEGNTIEEKWENFYKSIDNYVGDGTDPQKSISVIGITDYFTLDNYRKVLKDNKLPPCIKLVIPNVEMRIVPVSCKSPVNIHFLFEPSIVDKLDSRFFNKLEIKHKGIPYHPIRNDLIELGRVLAPNQKDENSLLKCAVEKFLIPWEQIEQLFQNDTELRKHVLIGITNNSKDGLSGVGSHELCEIGNGKQTDLYIESICANCDIIFSANPGDIDYFLGRKNNFSKQDIISKYGTLKPCVSGSDAHDNKSLFEPAANRYCWIKADPTFNGLRQIIFEPESRVRIQPTKPEQKENYYVIESVELNVSENAVNSNQNIFSKSVIPLNSNLNCIIGGKSTGKSLLLNNIAKAIDPSLDVQNVNNKQERQEVKKFFFTPDFAVKWKDGTISKSSSNSHDHKIVYIPQTYLNRVSDSDDGTGGISKFIKDLILKESKNSEAFTKMNNNINAFNRKTQIDIIELLNLQKEINELKEQEKEIGSKEGIESEINKNQQLIASFSRQMSISDADIQLYDSAENECSQLNLLIQKLSTDLIFIEKVEAIVQKLNFTFVDLTEEIAKKLSNAIDVAVEKANQSWQSSKAEIIFDIRKRIEDYEKRCEDKRIIIEQLSNKIKQNRDLQEKTELIKQQRQKLNSIIEIEEKINDREKKVSNYIDTLSELFDSYKSAHEEFANVINSDVSKFNSEDTLCFRVRTPFNSDAFTQLISESFYQKSLKNCRSVIDIDNFNIANFTKEKISVLIRQIIVGDIKLMKTKTPEDFLRSMLKDWYNDVFSVEMGDDTIGTMSPGKKALVLLKILIELEESKCPILIDQPEDDLDNRSIYSELVPFIRTRKINRQIIIVTHNANVVLGADAEEIIVANQNGANTPNTSYKFEYVTGSIEHNEICNKSAGILYRSSIQQHICDILEGGKEAFKQREKKYIINN